MSNINIDWNITTLVPTIIQDNISGQVRMLGYMNEESFNRTQDTGVVWFYSRSKQRFWQKGESSKNILNVVSIQSDCDQDTLLIYVDAVGPTCHTETQSCFGNDYPGMLANLERTIHQRKSVIGTTEESNSYTAQLLSQGVNAISAKVIEESQEVVQAAKQETDQRVIEEASDVLYHLIVLLTSRTVTLQQVFQELEKRSET